MSEQRSMKAIKDLKPIRFTVSSKTSPELNYRQKMEHLARSNRRELIASLKKRFPKQGNK